MLITRYPTSASEIKLASIPHFEAVKFTSNVSIRLDKHVSCELVV